MSEEAKKPEENKEAAAPKPAAPKAAPAAGAAKPAPAAAAKKEPPPPPPPPEPAEFEIFLKDNGIAGKTLGKNASGIEMIGLAAKDLLAAAELLKKKQKLNFLTYLTALEVKSGYQSIVQIDNHADSKAVVLKVTVSRENPDVPSLSKVFASANWLEREAYDMIGINYTEHPNLTRILNPEQWEGYPLRRDYIGPVDELNEPINYAVAS